MDIDRTVRTLRIRRRTRQRMRGRSVLAVAIDQPQWAEDDNLATYARALGLTAKWEAVGRDAPGLVADLYRLGRPLGFTVHAFGNSFTLTFSDGARHSVHTSIGWPSDTDSHKQAEPRGPYR